MVKASVILAFYNRIDFLELVLSGFERQTLKDFEIILADDGSSSKVINLLEKKLKYYSFPIYHLWQEDKGFRKNKMLNNAIMFSHSNFLIFDDADCIPHSEFVREHLINRESNVCKTGRRVNLSKKISDKLTPSKVLEGYIENNISQLIIDGVIGDSVDVEKGFYLKSNFLRTKVNKKKRGLLGCNFSIHKEDILLINGFDERYEAPSIGEDSDIQFRLELQNIKIKSLNNIAIQYHLFHKLQERPAKNLELFNQVRQSNLSFTPYGIRKLFL